MLLQFPSRLPLEVLVKSSSQGDPVPRKKDPKNQPKHPELDFSRYLLSDVESSSRSVNYTLSASQSPNLGLPSRHFSSPASHTALWPKSPLRRIIARAPHVDLDEERGTARITSYLHTLECGHQIFVQPFMQWDEGSHLIETPPPNKRHRCVECKGLEDAKKKPESVKAKKRRAA